MTRAAAILLLASGAASCQPIDRSKVIDLTYSFNEKTVYWPNAKGFHYEKDMWKTVPGGYWYAAGNFSAAEHGGTHFDSPIHFGKGKATTEQIPVSRLVGPAVVIDVSAACAKDRDYRATVRDLLEWEKQYGRIGPGTIVLFRTGWGKYWPDRKQYLGCDMPGDVEHLHFPGLSKALAKALVERRVDGAGIDTASLDYGPTRDFIVHRVLDGASIYGLENIAGIERLPSRGATLIALPMKIEGGTGGPARVIAILP
jgi:kynurenine formamidase